MIFWDTLKRLFLLNPFPTLFNPNPNPILTTVFSANRKRPSASHK